MPGAMQARDFADDARDPFAPVSLGPGYDVVRELGRGGMAIVYLARARATGAECAVKVIHTRFLGDAEALARFAREARVVGALQHPNIVPVHSVDSLGGAGLALVMDRVPGRTVKQILREDGPMSFERARSVLDDIAAALGYAHARGFVHRDVKPENIFVDETTGRALLSDFGIARAMHSETHLTLAGVTIGTPTYMAPEQIDGGDVDGRSDLYSLGLVGWEMLTGQRPWDGETLYKVIYHQKHDELPAIDTLRADTPLPLLIAIEGLLAKDPAQRWSSADEFRAQLATTTPQRRRNRAAGTAALTPDPSSDTIIVHRGRLRARHALTRIGLPTAALALLASAALLFARQRPSRADTPRTATTAAIRPVGNPGAQSTPPAPAVPVAGAAPTDPVPPPTSATAVSAAPAAAPVAAPATGRVLAPITLAVTATGAPLTSVPAPAAARPPVNITVPPPSPPAVPPAAAAGFTPAAHAFSIAAGASDSCVLTPAGVAYCWGGNDEGQLGTGGSAQSTAPVPVATGVRFARLVAGLSHTCALTPSGVAYCWGGNGDGQLGDGAIAPRASPTRVAGAHTFSVLAAGAAHTCGLQNGHAFCWGRGDHGQLGVGRPGDRTTPTMVATHATFSTLVAGWNHTCALTTDGVAYCWGANSAGQLGDGTTTDRSAPVAVRTDLRFVALAGGSAHTCALTAAGAAYCWGDDRYGQDGDGTTTTHPLPVMVSGGERFSAITAGGVHTCALTRAHVAWCWGRNNYGQLGNGLVSDSHAPVRVSGGHAFVSLDAFGAHTCGTTASEELFCWGYNLDGQLGDGTREHRTRPVYVDRPGTGGL